VILVDTNVIVALADRSDTTHELCRRWLEEQTDELALPLTVLAEACYLINRFDGPNAEAQFLDSVGSEPARRFRSVNLTEADLRRVAERHGAATIATINRRDFDNVRPRHVPAFTIVPT
jgi:uncharacterized protein